MKQYQASKLVIHSVQLCKQQMDELGPIYRRPHNRGLEQNCLPLALTNAITPALTPAQITEAINCCVFRPAIEQTIKLKFFSEYHIGRIYIYICTQVR